MQDPVSVTVTDQSRLIPAEAFAGIAPIDLTSIFTGWGPLPRVVSVGEQPDAWDRPGLTRRPRFADGGEALEQMTDYVAGERFAYRLTGFTNALRCLVREIRGEFRFAPASGGGSRIEWTYAFDPLPGRRTLLSIILAPMWRRYASATLQRAIGIVEGMPVSGTAAR